MTAHDTDIFNSVYSNSVQRLLFLHKQQFQL